MIINLTPHDCNLVEPMATFPASGIVARVTARIKAVGNLDGIPLTETTFGEVTGLPEPDGNWYIVSRMVRAACPERRDLLVPNESIRDDQGRIVGCKSFSTD